MSDKSRILVIDDEPAIRSILEKALKTRSYEVAGVGSAEEALAKIAEDPFDLLLVDKNLPRMSGVELIEQLRRDGSEVACILITAHASVESAVTTMRLGVEAYIEKPFRDLNNILDQVGRSLANQKRLQKASETRDRLRHATVQVESVAQATHAVPLKALVACPNDREREWLTRQVGDVVAETRAVRSDEEAMACGREAEEHLIVLDSALGWASIMATISSFQRGRPEATFILVADHDPGLDVLKNLIKRDVRLLLKRPISEEAFHSAVLLAARKVRSALQGRESEQV